MMEYIIQYKYAIIVAIIALILVITARNNEKRRFNDGVCPDCGGTWRMFDRDSSGARGYDCDKCSSKVWISYSVDKNYKI